MKRTLLIATLALALVVGACGNDSNDDTLSGAAVATTTTAVKPAGTAPGATSLDVAQGIAGPTNLAVGYVTSMSVGGVAITADLPAKIPGSPAGNVVGVLGQFTWSQVKTDPITLFMRTSNTVGAALTGKTGDVVMRLTIYTPNGSSYYASVRAARRDFFGKIASAPVVRASSGPTGVAAGRNVTVTLQPTLGTDVWLNTNPTSYVTKRWAAA